MYNLISCEYNMDTGCVELWFLDGSRISIDCTAVENAYAELILTGDPELYLKAVSDNWSIEEK